MKKKDVLILCQYFYPDRVTSAKLPYELAKFLVDNDFRVDVFTGYPKQTHENCKKYNKEEYIEGIHINRLKYIQLEKRNPIFRLINYFSFFISVFLHVFDLRDYKIIMIYSNPPILPILGILSKKLFNSKFVFVSFDVYPEIAIRTGILRNHSIIASLMRFVNKLLIKNVDKIVVLSSEMQRFYVNQRKISPSKVEIISNWSTDNFQSDDFNVSSNQKLNITLTYIGNIGIAQDFETLILALKKISCEEKYNRLKVKLLINFVGYGNSKNQLKKDLSEVSNIDINFYDFIQGHELIEVINSTDYLFLSLKKNLSGLAVPSKFYTYLETKRPIIAVIDSETDISKIIKSYKLGYSVQPGEVMKLVDTLYEILDNPPRESYQACGIYKKHNELEKYLRLIKKLYEDV